MKKGGKAVEKGGEEYRKEVVRDKREKVVLKRGKQRHFFKIYCTFEVVSDTPCVTSLTSPSTSG